jgi:hypothetical protein
MNSPARDLLQRLRRRRAEPRTDIADILRHHAEPLPAEDSPAFAEMFDRFADAKVLLIGEASHGTHDFYRTRAAITRHLIQHHGFGIVAVEADWPDAGQIDRPLCSPPRPLGLETTGLRTVSKLDVAQHGCPVLRPLAARLQPWPA